MWMLAGEYHPGVPVLGGSPKENSLVGRHQRGQQDQYQVVPKLQASCLLGGSCLDCHHAQQRRDKDPGVSPMCKRTASHHS